MVWLPRKDKHRKRKINDDNNTTKALLNMIYCSIVVFNLLVRHGGGHLLTTMHRHLRLLLLTRMM